MLLGIFIILCVLVIWSANLHRKKIGENPIIIIPKNESLINRFFRWLRMKKILPLNSRQKLLEEYRQWVNSSSLAKKSDLYSGLAEEASVFTAWLQRQSPQDAELFLEKITNYCRMLEIDLRWVFDPDVPDEVKGNVEEAVILYSLATWKAQDVQPFAAYKSWQEAPNKKENLDFARSLFSHLVDQRMATTLPDLMLSDENTQNEYIRQAIESAANKNSQRFTSILKITVAELVEGKKSNRKSPSVNTPPTSVGNPQIIEVV